MQEFHEHNFNIIFFFQSLIDGQERLAQSISGFHFNLGFSGKFFQHGSPDEDEGDLALIGKAMMLFN